MRAIYQLIMRALLGLAVLFSLPVTAWANDAASTFAEIGNSLDFREGFVDLYVDDDNGRVLARLPKPDSAGTSLRFIYATGITAGLGSNPIGLDRGAFNSGVIVRFRKIGNRVVAEQENLNYRASADNPLERRAVAQSFAPSFLWAADIMDTDRQGRLLIDITSFLTRDHFGIAAQIKGNPKGGSYALDGSRSVADFSAVHVFPDNVELDAFLTFTSDEPGVEPRTTAADARSVTLVQHHSLVRLPAPGFKAREYDPRVGAIQVAFYDFSAPLSAPIIKRLARRFRLERIDPNASSGPVKEPIIFYVDPGAPAQVRDALIDGAMWWADAFEAAGFEDAYRVEVLPEGAHPFDIRYNMIQWVHRQTRGWSYGGGVSDPRTGEMLKANVILGSQRVRQDRMIFEGLAGTEKTGTGASDDPVEIALARIRQLSAHEVGHTLGFAHNFAASSNDRASVMDYPAPLVTARPDGTLDFSNAYAVGMGEWDIFTTKWLYSEFPNGNTQAQLDEMVLEAYASGLRFVGDREARSVGTAHPYGSVWDNGEDAVASLENVMQVRRIALDNFDLDVIAEGRDVAELHNVIVPIYLYHRYQTAAASKLIGGTVFEYGVKGKAPKPLRPVPASAQREALTAILKTLEPEALDLPDELLALMTPELGTYGMFGGGAERFESDTGAIFDTVSAAKAAASISFSALLNPQRLARLADARRRDPAALSPDDVFEAIETQIFTRPENARLQPIAHMLQSRYVTELMSLAEAEGLPISVKAAVTARLEALQDAGKPRIRMIRNADAAHRAWLARRISAFLDRPAPASSPKSADPDIPPGSPIGATTEQESCWFCD